MRTRSFCLGLVLTAVMGLAPEAARCQDVQLPAPRVVRGQDYSPPDPVFPLPLYHERPETGGFYAAGNFLMLRQTNPLKEQPIAVRGFVDTFGNVQATQNFLSEVELGVTGPTPVPGLFIGSGKPALDVNQVSGPNSYQPGFRINLGWKFQNDLDIEFSWSHLFTKKLSATAAPIGPTLSGGPDGSDSFLFAPVYNFSNNYVGPASKLIVSTTIPFDFTAGPFPIGFLADQIFHTSPGPVGIWNAAQLMTIQFTQRYDDFEIIGRIPIYESDRCRCYGLFGPRHVQLWERFQWRTVDESVREIHLDIVGAGFDQVFNRGDAGGLSGPLDQAIYSNIVSNRLYGPLFGLGSDLYVGHGFGINLDLRCGSYIDVVKERAKYELGDHSTAAQRARTDYTMAFELAGRLNLTWYPIEGVELRFGYELQNFFNTVSSPQPIDFNMGSITPTWDKGTYRLLDGFSAGISFIF